jgi:galactokinase
MDGSHLSLQHDYETSCSEIDTIVDLAHAMGPAKGVFGCRITGGGFGGCVVALIETVAREAIIAELAQGYLARTGKKARFFTSMPAAGARIETL